MCGLAFGSLQRYPRELGLFDLRFESSLPDKKGLRFVNCPPQLPTKKERATRIELPAVGKR